MTDEGLSQGDKQGGLCYLLPVAEAMPLRARCGLLLTDTHTVTALAGPPWVRSCEGAQDAADLSSGSSLITLGEVFQPLFSYVQKGVNRSDTIMNTPVVTDQLWY